MSACRQNYRCCSDSAFEVVIRRRGRGGAEVTALLLLRRAFRPHAARHAFARKPRNAGHRCRLRPWHSLVCSIRLVHTDGNRVCSQPGIAHGGSGKLNDGSGDFIFEAAILDQTRVASCGAALLRSTARYDRHDPVGAVKGP
jgi:hypothetical protein